MASVLFSGCMKVVPMTTIDVHVYMQRRVMMTELNPKLIAGKVW